MANAYLGKISAIVTANTSDFNSKLNASAKEVRSFAASMQSSLTRAESGAVASLRGIYTESQKVSRALQAVASQRLDFKGFDNKTFASLNAAVDQFKKVQQAAVSVNEPLTRAAQTVEKLSASVQLSFDPAMKSAQKSAEYLSAALARGGIVGEKSFERIQRKAIAAAEAADRLAEASQLAAAGPRGTELAFAAPRVRDSLTASAAIRQQAANAPASVIEGGTIARDVQKLVTIDNLIQKRRTEVESGIALNIDIEPARASLENLFSISEKVRARISGAINADAKKEADQASTRFTTRRSATDRGSIGLFGRPAGTEEERALAAARKASEAYERLPETGREAVAGLAGIASRVADSVRDGTTSAAKLVAVLDILNAKIREQAPKTSTDLIIRPPTLTDAPAAPRGLGLFGSETSTAEEKSIARAKLLSNAYSKLPESARAGLAGLAGIAGRVANDVDAGRTKAENLDKVLDRIESKITSEKSFIPLGNLEKSAKDLKEIEKGFLAVRAAANFGTPLSEVFESAQIDSYKAKLRLLQDTLISSGVTSGEAAEAVSEYAAQLERAAKTKGGLAAAAGEIKQAESRAVAAVGSATPLGERALADRLKRIGDIGRKGFGNIGLGVQQAVFAFDDFFSVTGGLDQRIRAAGNNISQLGFVLGGTQGLIAGVAVSITAQLIVAYIKWQNAGVGVEDRLKSLNDALSRQKSLVEDLAGAFRAIADEIANIGFSKPGADAAKFQQQLDDIRKKQKEFNQERFAELDPDVQRERGIVASREARLAKEEDPAVRLRLQGEINNARRREAEAARSARDAAPITAVEGARVAVESRRAREVQIAREAESPNQEANANNRARQRQEDIDRRLGAASGERERQEIARDQLLFERNRLIREARSNDFSGAGILAGGSSNSEQLTAVEIAIRQLDQAIVDSADRLEVEVASAAVGAAKQIGLAQAKVADAIEAGVPGALGLQVQLDGLTQQLFKAQNDLATSQEKARKGGTGEDIVAATKARDEVARIQDAINQRGGEIKAIEASRRAFELFATAFDKVRQEAESNLQSAESARDQARGDVLEQQTPESRQRLAGAEGDRIRQAGLRNNVRFFTAMAEESARQDEGVRRREDEIARIDGQLSSSGVLALGQRDGLIARREKLRQENESSVRNTVDSDPNLLAARDASTKEERRRQSAERGRQASQTPAQKAGEELAGTIRDIQNNFERQPGGVAGNAAEAADAGRRAANDAFRTSAPAILGLADQVQNAVLQGPSRAALNATDVSTVEGSRELNRLLRGDDAAKNQDLVELQKQSQSLETLVQLAREQGVPETLDF